MATTDDGPALWREVQLLHLQLTALLHRGLTADVGLAYQDFVVLAELAAGPRRVVDLARSLGLEKSRLSHQLNRLEERGLVAKRPTPGDGRGAAVALTAAGRRLHGRALPGHLERVRRHFADHVTPAEAAALRSVTGKVRAALDDLG